MRFFLGKNVCLDTVGNQPSTNQEEEELKRKSKLYIVAVTCSYWTERKKKKEEREKQEYNRMLVCIIRLGKGNRRYNIKSPPLTLYIGEGEFPNSFDQL